MAGRCYTPHMIESIQHFLFEPVPNWLFLGIGIVLWCRDWQLKKGLVLIGRILDDNGLEERPPLPMHD